MSKFFSKNIVDLVLSNKIIPFSVGLVFSFDQDENPEILIGICQSKEIDHWIDLYGEKAKYYAWNVAEYEIFEDEGLYVDTTQLNKMDSRGEYIDFLLGLLPSIESDLKVKTGYSPYLFTHDLDDDDFESFLALSLSNDQINELKTRKII